MASATRRVLQNRRSTLAPVLGGCSPPCCACCDFQQGLGRRASAVALATLRLLLHNGPTTPALTVPGLPRAARLRRCAHFSRPPAAQQPCRTSSLSCLVLAMFFCRCACCFARRGQTALPLPRLLLSWPTVARALPPLRPRRSRRPSPFARDASFALAPQPCHACLGRPWRRQARYACIPASQYH